MTGLAIFCFRFSAAAAAAASAPVSATMRCANSRQSCSVPTNPHAGIMLNSNSFRLSTRRASAAEAAAARRFWLAVPLLLLLLLLSSSSSSSTVEAKEDTRTWKRRRGFATQVRRRSRRCGRKSPAD